MLQCEAWRCQRAACLRTARSRAFCRKLFTLVFIVAASDALALRRCWQHHHRHAHESQVHASGLSACPCTQTLAHRGRCASRASLKTGRPRRSSPTAFTGGRKVQRFWSPRLLIGWVCRPLESGERRFVRLQNQRRRHVDQAGSSLGMNARPDQIAGARCKWCKVGTLPSQGCTLRLLSRLRQIVSVDMMMNQETTCGAEKCGSDFSCSWTKARRSSGLSMMSCSHARSATGAISSAELQDAGTSTWHENRTVRLENEMRTHRPCSSIWVRRAPCSMSLAIL